MCYVYYNLFFKKLVTSSAFKFLNKRVNKCSKQNLFTFYCYNILQATFAIDTSLINFNIIYELCVLEV